MLLLKYLHQGRSSLQPKTKSTNSRNKCMHFSFKCFRLIVCFLHLPQFHLHSRKQRFSAKLFGIPNWTNIPFRNHNIYRGGGGGGGVGGDLNQQKTSFPTTGTGSFIWAFSRTAPLPPRPTHSLLGMHAGCVSVNK